MKAIITILCILFPILALILFLSIRRSRMKATRTYPAEMPNKEEETS